MGRTRTSLLVQHHHLEKHPHRSSRNGTRERKRHGSSNAAPLPAVAQETGAADNAAPAPAPHTPANRPPFNGEALLREQPLMTQWPDFPLLADIERRVRRFFAQPSTDEDPTVLEPINEATLYSRSAERTQKFSFVMNRNSPMPIPTTWDPLVFCNGEGEQACFHCALRELRIIQATRWASGKTNAVNRQQLRQDLQTLPDQHVPSFGHMILLSYAVRLYNKDADVPAIVSFLRELFDNRDFEHDIPKLLADYQPRMILPGTREPWPSEHDFRIAAKRWVGYCQRAYKDIFERLSGPIFWIPEWLLSKDLPSAARQAFDKMATNAAIHLDTVRHMVYRHFVLKHVLAVMHQLDYEWEAFDHIADRDLLAEGEVLSLSKTVIFVDRYTLHYFGAALKDKNSSSVIDHFLDLYPSREVERLIFWFGTEYIVDNKNDDFGGLVAFLSHHLATQFGFPEQTVIAPPYIRAHEGNWTDNVLGLLVQKDILLPHARLIIDQHDLQLWRHDYFPTSTARAAADWPGLMKNGRLCTPHSAEQRKHHLRKYHGLDLWQYYKKDHPMAPMPSSILERTTADGSFTEPGIVKVAADNAASETP